jgi:hypothetical protein
MISQGLGRPASGHSPDRDPLVGSFAERLWGIEHLHPGGRKLERTGVIEAHGIYSMVYLPLGMNS